MAQNRNEQVDDRLLKLAAQLERSNEALRSSEERYHKMIEEVQDYAILLLDVQGRIQNWNRGAEQIKGYKAEEIIGQNFRIFYRPEDRAEGLPEKLITEATVHGKALHEGWRLRKDGSRFWGSVVITALHADEGSLIGFSKVTRDLTERKFAEDKLKEYLTELEARNRELEQFAYIASHDLQEPLRKIRTFSAIIGRQLNQPETISRYLEKIESSARRMTDLVASVLEYSQLSFENRRMEDCDLNQMLENVRTDYDLLLQERDGAILGENLPVIKAFAPQINQLFTNLIGNALKFSEKAPLIRVTSYIIDEDQILSSAVRNRGRYICISIADNGIGFDQQYADLIFTMFQRLHGQHEYAGTGIGLALCKRIMENHNGWISATSEPGYGATFNLYFPLSSLVL